MKSCDEAHNNPPQPSKPVKRSRIKKACDKCAKLKSKCDYQRPCSQCVRKSSLCEYTREYAGRASISYGPDSTMPHVQTSTEQPERSWLPETAEYDIMTAFARSAENSHDGSTVPEGSVSVGMASPDSLFELPSIDMSNQALTQSGSYLEPNAAYDWNSETLNFDFANFCEPYFEGPSLPMYLSTIVESPHVVRDTGKDHASHS